MAGQGNPFPRNYSTGNSSESNLFPKPNPEEKGKEHLYSVDNKVVNDLRIFTRAYVKKIGGLPIIHVLPRREYKKKDRPILEDAVVNPKIPHIALYVLHHPRTPSHNPHITPSDLPLDPHTSKRAQG